MKIHTIDLAKYRTPGSKVFTGRPRGLNVRKASGIDEAESQYDKIIISIPLDIASINPSFLEEFLENVVKKLGEKPFMEKFTFDNAGRYKIDIDLAEAIERILRKENALS